MAAKPLSRRGQFTVGVLVAAIGLCVAVLAASQVGKVAGRLDPVVAFIIGLTLAFCGAVLVAPERDGRMRAWFGALMVTCVALLFDWVALGLGESRGAAAAFSVNASARSHFWQVPGQVLLVSGAILFNLMALWAWFRARRVRRKTAKA
jgi:hypothetical protein